MSMVSQGDIILAAPSQGTSFERAVVLITEHHSRGTVGLVINHPHELTPAQALGWEMPMVDTLFRGGPVNTRALVMLHDTGWFSENTMTISEDLAISSDTFMLEKIAAGNTPKHYRLIAGISGWAPGQLAAEIDGTAPYAGGRPQWLVAGAAGSRDRIFSQQGVLQWHTWIELTAKRAVREFFG